MEALFIRKSDLQKFVRTKRKMTMINVTQTEITYMCLLSAIMHHSRNAEIKLKSKNRNQQGWYCRVLSESFSKPRKRNKYYWGFQKNWSYMMHNNKDADFLSRTSQKIAMSEVNATHICYFQKLEIEIKT